MQMIKGLVTKLQAFIEKDDHQSFYVSGSGPVRVSNARAHQISKVIAEHHRDYAMSELRKALIIGRR